VRHFHEKLREKLGIALSYTWVKLALQGAGLVKKSGRRGVHRRRRPRRPLPGMLLHLDGSSHAWLGDGRRYVLLVVLDDATSEIYYAQLVEQESTRTVPAALRAVVEKKGLFCALYSDRASHFFETPKAGAKIDPQRLTQVGRALQQLGMRMIPTYSPRARGRSERNFGTWQGDCLRNCACVASPQWKKRIAFCGRSTWRSSTGVLRLGRRNRGAPFCRWRARTWSVSLLCNTSGW
jgi:hypothetical protein